MAAIKLGSHPDRPIDVKHLSGQEAAALTEAVGEGGTSAGISAPHVIKVSGEAGCHFWPISGPPIAIADNSGIYPVLQDVGFVKLFYTSAARQKIFDLYA